MCLKKSYVFRFENPIPKFLIQIFVCKSKCGLCTESYYGGCTPRCKKWGRCWLFHLNYAMKDIGACNHLSNCNLSHEDKKHLRPERKPLDDAKYTINKSEHTPRPSLSIWMNPFYIVCYSLLSSMTGFYSFSLLLFPIVGLKKNCRL